MKTKRIETVTASMLTTMKVRRLFLLAAAGVLLTAGFGVCYDSLSLADASAV